MTPKRPYILRALYEWLVDNELTPHLVVDAEWPHTYVPRQYVKDGQIVLNVAPSALQGLQINNDTVQFFARFNGVEQKVIIPMGALLALYSRENGAGTIFEPEQAYIAESQASLEPVARDVFTEHDTSEVEARTADKTGIEKKKGPSLRVVK